MNLKFDCLCGFSTYDAETARVHLARCVAVKPKVEMKQKELPPITILVTALEEMNKIITAALDAYYKEMAKRKRDG